MSSATVASPPATTPAPQSQSGQRRRHRTSKKSSQAGGRGRTPSSATASTASNVEPPSTTALDTSVPPTVKEAAEESAVSSTAVCWICAEPVRYYAVSECNHRTCHVCALRLRALYRKMECTFCKHPQDSIIYTVSSDTPFESYGPNDTPFHDSKLRIYFETQEMMEDTLLLLRFNCPDGDCAFFGNGWVDLKAHVRTTHKKAMCDLCVRNKKIFAHEHHLYTVSELLAHVPSMTRRGHARDPDAAVEGGVHPLCEFCNECFFGDDELYVHMRERHEKCFVCDREGRKFNYFRNYEELAQHFNTAHFPCNHPNCLEQKFVVFGSSMDLKAHVVEQHGGDMSSRDRKDARRVGAEFAFQQEPLQSSSGQRGSRRRNGFGAALTVPDAAPVAPTPVPTPPREDPAEDLPPEIAQRQTDFLTRFSAQSSLAVRLAVRSFRASESTARDIILTIFNIFDRDLDAMGGIMNALVALFEEEKRRDLLTSWNNFKLEQRREFPDLVPAPAGTEYSGITAGRVLNVKHSTARGSANRRVWDRVAQAAASTPGDGPSTSLPQTVERFPALAPAQARQPAAASLSSGRTSHSTPWTSSAAATPAFRPAVAEPKPGAPAPRKPTRGSAKLDETNFPGLPAASGPSHAQRIQGKVSGNASLRNIVGPTAVPASPWGVKATDTPPPDPLPPGEAPEPPASNKKKGKQKQTLFTLGTFPSS